MESDTNRLDALARRRGRGNGAAPPGGFASEFDLWLAEDLDAAADSRYRLIFEEDPEPPPILIERLIPMEAFGLVGPGGTAKSTFALWLMLHVVLGWPIGSRRVITPGACLYVSAEDGADVVRYRIRRLVDALGLDDLQRAIVARRLIIEDWTGTLRRLVAADGTGNLAITHWADGVVSKYRDSEIRLSVFDPAIFFGPGERYVNDAEAALMQAARRIGRGLGGAAVGYIHHTSQLAAREQVTDQYAGRGGSAFADNSRAQLVLHPHNKDSADHPRPMEVPKEAVEDGRAFRMHVAKFSAGKRDRGPVWIVRGDANPWRFEIFEPVQDLAAHTEAVRADADARADDLVLQHVEALQYADPPTKATLKEAPPVGLSRRAALAAVDRLIASGRLFWQPLPPEQKHGSRVRGLRVGPQPVRDLLAE